MLFLSLSSSMTLTYSHIKSSIHWSPRLMNGQNLTVLTPHDISGILNSKVQSDNGSVFKAAVTQGVSKALEVEYHTVPGDSNLEKKFEKANDIIKRHPCKLSQETQDSWLKVLPMALMRAWTAPKKKGLSLWQTVFVHIYCHRSWSLKINYWTQLLAFQQTLLGG